MADRAVITPWLYAPPSSSHFWNEGPVEKRSAEIANHFDKRSPAIPVQEAPLTLAELIDIALQNNTQTRQSWAQARAAAAQYGQAQQNYFPTADFTYNYQRTRALSGFTGINTDAATGITSITSGSASSYLSQWGPQLALSYLIFDFGQTRASSMSALNSLFEANLTHNRMIQTVIQTITTDYYNYLYQQMLLDAYVQDIADAQVTLDAAQTGLQAGVKNISDVLQARSQLLQLQTTWVDQRQTVHTAFAQLLTDMGVPAHFCFDLAKLPEHPPLFAVMASVNDLIADALTERCDLRAAEADLVAKKEALLAAKLQFLPTMNGTFDIGRTYYTGGIDDDYDFQAILSFNWPIFSGFATYNAVRQAQAQKEQSEALLRETELSVIEEITTSHFNLTVARDAVRYTDEYLDAAKEEFGVALAQYKAGTTDILTVTSAMSTLADARAKRANALQQWFVSVSSFAYATGTIGKKPIPHLVPLSPTSAAQRRWTGEVIDTALPITTSLGAP